MLGFNGGTVSLRILLVEDEEKVHASEFAVLRLVDAAADGPSGLELANPYNYDLIVLDLMIPGLSGTGPAMVQTDPSGHLICGRKLL